MKKLCWFLTIIILAAGRVSAAGTEEQSGDEARELIEKQKAAPLVPYYKNDFYLSTPDESFQMRIRGNVHFDSKFYPWGEGTNPTQFDIRRARMDFQGVFYDYISFRVQAEFADAPYIRNAWADYRLRDWLHVRGGQMKPPFSTSWWTLDNRVNFLERGAGTPVYPYFDRGWWIWGDLFDGSFSYNVAAFTGAGMDFDYKKGDIDDHKDVFLRFFTTPFKNTGLEGLEGLSLCVQGSRGEQSIPTTRFETKGYGAAIRDDMFWSWTTEEVGYGEIGRRDRWGAELHYILGPVSLSSEYLVTSYYDVSVFADDDTRVIHEDGEIVSWSSWLSVFLTGESKGVSNFGWRQPSPNKDYDPVTMQGPGSWEVLARYTRTETSEELFEPVTYGVDRYVILSGAQVVEEYTVGISWGWNAMVRWQLNWTRLDCNDDFGDIRTGDSANLDGVEYVETEDMIGLRMIFKF